MLKKYDFYIGIDTGVNTGFAVWNKEYKRLLICDSMKIHQAMQWIIDNVWQNGSYIVRVEDARLRKWLPKDKGRAQLQGAGSIKRDAVIWEDFLKDLGVDYEMVAPKNNKTKINAEYFKKVTGWEGKTNEHARDAAFLVFGY
ncbi:MAG: hypothetical protein WKF88_05670 [Ferruginibacter sp.]